ncbi:hypothetical protein ACJX0J_037828 [Zea mays]
MWTFLIAIFGFQAPQAATTLNLPLRDILLGLIVNMNATTINAILNTLRNFLDHKQINILAQKEPKRNLSILKGPIYKYSKKVFYELNKNPFALAVNFIPTQYITTLRYYSFSNEIGLVLEFRVWFLLHAVEEILQLMADICF